MCVNIHRVLPFTINKHTLSLHEPYISTLCLTLGNLSGVKLCAMALLIGLQNICE